MRIVSLLPGATEILRALGLEENLVGVSHECFLPEGSSDLPRVTSTLLPDDLSSREIDQVVHAHARDKTPLYHLRSDLLEALCPDLILTQTLCQVCAVSEKEVHAVARSLPSSPSIIDLEPTSLTSVFEGIQKVAQQAKVPEVGEKLVCDFMKRIEQVSERSRQFSAPPRVAFLEWLDPLFASGHWNPELVRLAGGIDLLGIEGEPARRVDWQEILDMNPEILFISCCGFTMERTLEDLHLLTGLPGWGSLPAVREGKIFVADGRRHFSSPGPELVDSLEILAHALDPSVHPLPIELLPAHRVGE